MKEDVTRFIALNSLGSNDTQSVDLTAPDISQFEIQEGTDISNDSYQLNEKDEGKKTYVEALVSNITEMQYNSCNHIPQLQDPKPSYLKEGYPAVTFSQTDIQQAEDSLKFSVITRCIRGKFNMEEFRKVFLKSFRIASNTAIGQIDNRHILIKTSESDMKTLLAKGY